MKTTWKRMVIARVITVGVFYGDLGWLAWKSQIAVLPEDNGLSKVGLTRNFVE